MVSEVHVSSDISRMMICDSSLQNLVQRYPCLSATSLSSLMVFLVPLVALSLLLYHQNLLVNSDHTLGYLLVPLALFPVKL
jgi:uncharacterized membrane protein YkgB